MREHIERLLDLNTNYLQKTECLNQIKAEMSGFQKSLQNSLEKKSKLSPKTGIPKSYEELSSMDRECKELKDRISKLHFWESKEKRSLRTVLEEKEKQLSEQWGIYYHHQQWKNVEDDIAFFSQRVENDKQVLAELEQSVKQISGDRSATGSELIRMIDEADKETLQEAFQSDKYALLPADVLCRVIEKCQYNLWPNLPVSIQVKLLYPCNTTVSFGGYSWNVVEIRKNKALLLANRLCLMHELHRDGIKHPEWENSYAREYLNGAFLKNIKAKKQGEVCRNQDGDYVFLLSEDEVKKYLTRQQMAVPEGSWWLRDVSDWGEDLGHYARYVDGFRQVLSQYPNYTLDSNGDKLGFRPALWVKLNPGETDGWESKRFPISCKGFWSTNGKYDGISISLDHAMERMKGYGSVSTENSDPLGYRDGVRVDTTGI